MNCCNHCKDAGSFFNNRTAKKELRRYKRRGPNKSTRLLLDEIRKHDLNKRTLLDIGGGIGAISFELFEQDIESSTHVDASTAYLEAAEKEAEERRLNNRIKLLFGDFTEISKNIEDADIVTLDRVICCYPDMNKLVDRSANKSKLYYGVVYPRRQWWIGTGVNLVNLYFKLRGSDFRTYHHSPSEIDSRIKDNGFSRIFHSTTIIWEVALYKKST